jgi:plastocyanin
VKRVRSLVVIVAVVSSLGLTAACSDSKSEGGEATTTTAASGGPTSTAPDPAKVVDLTGKQVVQITVKDNAYEPRYFKVSPGTKIVFTNKGANDHTVHPANDGAFTPISGPQLESGKSASITLAKAGGYTYYCRIHGTPTFGQNGYIEVG